MFLSTLNGNFALDLSFLHCSFLCFFLFFITSHILTSLRILLMVFCFVVFFFFLFFLCFLLLVFSITFTMVQSVQLFFFYCTVSCFPQWSHPFYKPCLYYFYQIILFDHIWKFMSLLLHLSAGLYVKFMKIYPKPRHKVVLFVKTQQRQWMLVY